MPEWLSRYLPETWTESELIIGALILTICTAVVSLIGVGIVIVRIPENYFVGDRPPPIWTDRHPVIRFTLHVLKNLVGVILVVLGIMLSLPGIPGQGLLTILIGAMLIDGPGKRRAEKWLLRRRGVLRTINRIRARAGRPPLLLDAPATTA